MAQSVTPPWLVGEMAAQAAMSNVEQFLRVAVLGRTSTKDLQDPTISLPRQFNACEKNLPPGAQIVAFYYDIESGRTDLDRRGMGNAHEQFDIPIPRTGGIKDLLRDARRRDRGFDIVMCESIDRLARITYFSTRIEHELEELGVALLAADEPVVATRRKLKNATTVLTRRVKQGISEWYVLDLMEKSWGGTEVHTQAGFNIGKPLYGYQANRTPHPVAEKRAAGISKTRLEIDPTRAAVVRRIFELRIGRSAGYEAIAAILNQDLALNPPPEPSNPVRARGDWCGATVREILRNPKYTGYMVWNRHATKSGGNRINPMNEWVWSPEPTHEAIVSPEQFSAAQQASGYHARRRNKSTEQRQRADYRLRSIIRCGLCGLRMYGAPRKERIYYSCHPKRGSRPDGHPAATYLREDLAERVVEKFLDSYLLGAQRTGRLRALADQLEATDAAELERERDTLVAALADSEKRKSKLVRVFELAEEFDNDLIQSVVERQRQLAQERHGLRTRIETIEESLRSKPDVRIVDAFPCDTIDTDRLPTDKLRRLLQAFRVELVHQPEAQELTCHATVTPMLAEIVRNLLNEVENVQDGEKPAQAAAAVRVDDVARVGFEPTLYGF